MLSTCWVHKMVISAILGDNCIWPQILEKFLRTGLSLGISMEFILTGHALPCIIMFTSIFALAFSMYQLEEGSLNERIFLLASSFEQMVKIRMGWYFQMKNLILNLDL